MIIWLRALTAVLINLNTDLINNFFYLVYYWIKLTINITINTLNILSRSFINHNTRTRSWYVHSFNRHPRVIVVDNNKIVD